LNYTSSKQALQDKENPQQTFNSKGFCQSVDQIMPQQSLSNNPIIKRISRETSQAMI